MGKISVNELAAKLIDRKGLSKKQSASFVNEMFYLIQKGLEKDKSVKIKGFGTFKIITVDDRESINVNTGERVLIGGHSKITFTPDSVIKELVNKPFSQFETVVLRDGVDFDDMDKIKEEEEEPTVEEEPAVEFVDAASAPLVDFGIGSEEREEVTVVEVVPEAEPEPESDSEPVVEPKVVEQVDNEVATKDNPKADGESQIEAESRTEDNPQTEVNPQTEDAVQEGPNDEEFEYEEEPSGAWKKWILPIVCLIVGFIAGYFVGNIMNSTTDVPQQPKQEEIAQPQPKADVAVPPAVKPEEKAEVEKDDEAEEKEELKATKEEKQEVKPESRPEPKPEPQKEIKQEPKVDNLAPVALDKYEQMDSRIRTGAYRIVGTDHVEKIKTTDNLSRICKRTLGPGMECYLEVYNGIKGDTDLKPGKDIKIPKLELKKKKVKK